MDSKPAKVAGGDDGAGKQYVAAIPVLRWGFQAEGRVAFHPGLILQQWR
jgi:hypothetical protein